MAKTEAYENPFEELSRELERLLGYPPGAFDPLSPFLRDAERINRALGGGLVLLQEVFGSQQLLGRIEAALEFPGGREVLELPRKMWGLRPPWPDKEWRRY